MKIIDTHCHFLTKEYLDALARYGRINEDGFPVPEWNLEMQLEYMETVGIDHAVLSLSTPHPCFGDDGFDRELNRSINETAAELKRRFPEKFSFAATLPLPNVDDALEEARYAVETLGACGVKLASQSNGLYLGDWRLDPLMEYINEKESVIVIHPSRPQAVPERCFTSGPLPLLEFINDTTRAVINMLASGTLEKYPKVKVLVPHCGSFLPNIIDRLTGITKLFEQKGIGKAVDVKAGLQSLYFDIAGDAFPRGMQILRTLADDGHIMFGGDFPYTPVSAIQKKREDLENMKISKECLDNYTYQNAEKFFHLFSQ